MTIISVHLLICIVGYQGGRGGGGGSYEGGNDSKFSSLKMKALLTSSQTTEEAKADTMGAIEVAITVIK